MGVSYFPTHLLLLVQVNRVQLLGLYGYTCLSGFQSGSSPCKLISLVGIRKVMIFQFVQLFLIVIMGRTTFQSFTCCWNPKSWTFKQTNSLLRRRKAVCQLSKVRLICSDQHKTSRTATVIEIWPIYSSHCPQPLTMTHPSVSAVSKEVNKSRFWEKSLSLHFVDTGRCTNFLTLFLICCHWCSCVCVWDWGAQFHGLSLAVL